MNSAENGLQAAPDLQVWVADDAFRTGQRAERAWLLARAAQRSAAKSLDDSADSHERTADAYDEAVKHGGRQWDGYGEHAAIHRAFALEDRRMAQRLRQMADVGPMGFAAL